MIKKGTPFGCAFLIYAIAESLIEPVSVIYFGLSLGPSACGSRIVTV